MTDTSGAWWRPVALLVLIIAFGMNLLVWHTSGGIDFLHVFEQIGRGFILAFAGTSLALLFISLGSVHRHTQWKEQIFGLLLLSGFAFYLAHSQYDGSIEEMSKGGIMLLSGLVAVIAAIGLVFGLLLALVTGREHIADPLLGMQSTGGDVPIELNE